MIYKRWITFRSELEAKNVNYFPIYYVIFYDKTEKTYVYLRCNIFPSGTQEIQLLNNDRIDRFNFEKREDIVDYKNTLDTETVFQTVVKQIFGDEGTFKKYNTLFIGNWKTL